MQRKKNLRLLVILAVLVVVTVLLYSIGGERRGTNVETEQFAVADTAAITRVEISKNQEVTVLSRESGRWLVNDKFSLDEGMRTVLLSVLHRVSVQRPVAEVVQEEVVDNLQQEGYRVSVYAGNQRLMEYQAGGDREANVTYFKKPEEATPYVVHLPGYESYVAGLFEITENDWRDRIIMATDWNFIDSLRLIYPQNPESSFSIVFRNQQYQVPEVAEADTSILYNFMDQVSYILADRYIDRQEFPLYDSLSQTDPLAILKVKEIADNDADQVLFYPPLPGDDFLLGKTGEQLILFELNRMRNILIRRESLLTD